jgi:cold shock CspA family protein
MAMENPIEHGVIKSFCRVKGHGFIKKDDGEDIFVHVSEYDFFSINSKKVLETL